LVFLSYFIPLEHLYTSSGMSASPPARGLGARAHAVLQLVCASHAVKDVLRNRRSQGAAATEIYLRLTRCDVPERHARVG
jgi:hypothetical protein